MTPEQLLMLQTGCRMSDFAKTPDILTKSEGGTWYLDLRG